MWHLFVSGEVDVASIPVASDPMIARQQDVGECLPQTTTAYEQFTEDCLAAIDLWLRWDERNRHLTERLFAARGASSDVEALLDECDSLRREAAEVSRRALARLDGPSATRPTGSSRAASSPHPFSQR